MTIPAIEPDHNGRAALTVILRGLVAAAALLGLIYFGLRIGTSEHRLTTVENGLSAHEARVTAEHLRMEHITDEKVAQQKELILAELRAINTRLERIERRLP